jgi:hypothetical protein
MKTTLQNAGSMTRAQELFAKQSGLRNQNRDRCPDVLRSTTGCDERIRGRARSDDRWRRASLAIQLVPTPDALSRRNHKRSKRRDSSGPAVPPSLLRTACQVCDPRPDSASSTRAISTRMRASALSSLSPVASARAFSRRRRASVASIRLRSSASSARTMT